MVHTIEIWGAVFLAVAVLHTFSVSAILKLGDRFAGNSVLYHLCHLLGEVEIAFGFWALVFLGFFAFIAENPSAHLLTLQFTEPFFVAEITLIAATKPILELASWILEKAAKLIPLPLSQSLLLVLLSLGPLLGSFMTEPAAMVVTSLVLHRFYFSKSLSPRLRYSILAVLLVNISIGGVLTHFAAPPVVMVAHKWGWTTSYMFTHFGWKAVWAVGLNSSLLMLVHRRELSTLSIEVVSDDTRIPIWVSLVSVLCVALVAFFSHQPVFLFGIFAAFLGFYFSSRTFQETLKWKQALLVGFFLSGVVFLGSFQSWWVKPLIEELSPSTLFLGATLLTSITDNAALTYLGSQIPNLEDLMRYMLVAGSVTGGGLTVIANAPNPIGFAILEETFPEGVTNPLKVVRAALVPTAIAASCFYFL